MSNPDRIDPERLAALIDGRLTAADAAAVRAQLANADDETLMAFADASSIANELESDAPIIAFPPKTANRRHIWFWGGVGAIAAGIAILVIRQNAARDLTAPMAPAQMIAAIGDAAAPDALPWPTTRGTGPELTSSSRAVRLGVLLVDADASGTPQSVRRSKIEMAESLIREIPGGGAIAPTMDMLAVAPTANGNSDARAAAERRVMEIVGSELAEGGAWLESAHIALRNGRLEFFDRAPVVPVLARLRGRADDAETRAKIDSLIAASTARPVDTHAVESLIATLLASLTR